MHFNVIFLFDFSLVIKKTYSQVEFDEIKGEWATTFVLQLIMNHVDAS